MRHTKAVVLVGGVLWLAAWAAWGTQGGLATAWAVTGAVMVALYAACGWISYRGPRVRWAAAAASGALTAVVAFLSFFHLGLVAGGLAVTVGCALRPS